MQTVEHYQPLRLTYHCTDDKHGFDGKLEATFTHESGTRIKIVGFYDGQATYRISFLPTRTGRWDFALQTDLPLEGEPEGTLEVTSSSRPGLLRTDPAHPHHFIYESGRRFFPLGNTAYNLLTAFATVPDEAKEFVGYYAERGFNWFRFFLEQVTWGTNGAVVWPWGGSPEEPRFDVYNLRTFRLAEQAIKYLGEQGCIASVILLHPMDKPFARLRERPAAKIRIVKDYLRYAVARLACYPNVVWNMANEWDRGGNFTPEEIEHLGAFLHEIDPYDHLTACHHYPRFEFSNSVWTDMASMQHRGCPHEINQVAIVNRAFGKPVLNEEYGYEQDTISPPNDPVNVRRDHWALTMAGCYGTYGDKTKGPKVAVYFSSVLKDSIGAEVPAYLGNVRRIMEETRYWEMSPCNELIQDCVKEQVFCLARPGREYVVYCCVGQDFRLDLCHVYGISTEIEYAWFNPVSGEVVDSGRKRLASAKASSNWKLDEDYRPKFTPPDYVADWLLIVRPVCS